MGKYRLLYAMIPRPPPSGPLVRWDIRQVIPGRPGVTQRDRHCAGSAGMLLADPLHRQGQ